MAFRKPPPVRIIKPPKDAPGVSYETIQGAPQKMFACLPYRAKLTREGCAARWREGQTATGHDQARFALCRGCPIGAAHAGEEFVRYSWLYGAPVCPRCRKGGLRMIGNAICISCYNRRNELAKGKNARGNIPVRLIAERPLHQVTYRVVVNGKTFAKTVPSAVDLLEPVLQTLRTTKGDIAFGFRSPLILRQGSLF